MFWIKAQTIWALGVLSISRVFIYRFGLKFGLNTAQQKARTPPKGVFFLEPPTVWQKQGDFDHFKNDIMCFGWFQVPLHDKPPHWHYNFLSGKKLKKRNLPWWKIPDFDPEWGDIKVVWELSRFDWAPVFALQYRLGHRNALQVLNTWINDWCQANPPYWGPNWKCGQEASIRVMHLAMAALFLEQDGIASEALQNMLRIHLERIEPTLRYAIGQNNNHGTSEAAALFMGGRWLFQISQDEQAQKWERIGRRWLEDRVAKLIEEDGSFSQYSLNYHRMLLDTLSIVEIWRRKTQGVAFSDRFIARCQAATVWLLAFTDDKTGEVPNIGANDGAHLLSVVATGFRDFRPSIKLASALFLKKAAFSPGVGDHLLKWLNIDLPTTRIEPLRSCLFDQGGYAKLSCGTVRAYVRYPRFRFRPGHADALHVDLWLGETNVFRDGGSYSYAAASPWQSYFPGTGSHNTVQFDDRDQMPRLSRFLFGSWLKADHAELKEKGNSVTFSASYRDWKGAQHRRQVSLDATHFSVTDHISGFHHKAVLRWRLLPGDWQYINGAWCWNNLSLKVTADMPITRMELLEGWESRYYLKRDPIPVLEVECDHAGRFYTVLTGFGPATSGFSL